MGSVGQRELRAEPGSSCELSCNPSVCCNEPSGCHGPAAPGCSSPAAAPQPWPGICLLARGGRLAAAARLREAERKMHHPLARYGFLGKAGPVVAMGVLKR